MLAVLIKRLIWDAVPRKKRYLLLRKEGVKIGTGCEIFRDVNFGSEPYLIEIGNNVRITSGVKFCTHDGGMWCLRNLGVDKKADFFGKIRIKDNVHIGWNSIIMPGVTIGKNCVIGCGSIVTRDIPDGSVAAGIPARVLSATWQYYEKKKDRFVMTADMNPSDKKIYLKKYFNDQ